MYLTHASSIQKKLIPEHQGGKKKMQIKILKKNKPNFRKNKCS